MDSKIISNSRIKKALPDFPTLGFFYENDPSLCGSLRSLRRCV